MTPMVHAFRERHDHVVARLNKLRGVRCLPSNGTFYAFALFKDAITNFEGMTNDLDMAELILNEAGVALVPGSAFGAEGYMRLSFATSPAKLDQALDRLEKLLGRADA
jgi:aspartate aminotransferase